MFFFCHTVIRPTIAWRIDRDRGLFELTDCTLRATTALASCAKPRLASETDLDGPIRGTAAPAEALM
jgi:hypothetical protein